MPEVAATAAPVHSTAAPGYVDDPASTPVTPWVFVVAGTGHWPARATSVASKPNTSVCARSSPILATTRPQSASVHRFEPASCDGQRGVHGGAGDRPGRHIDAAGDVDGDHRCMAAA